MSLKQFFLALVLGALSIQAGLMTCAHAEPSYEVVLEDEFGNALPSYPTRSERFALGRDGQRYNVRIYNHSGRRVEAVVSVDGRDVLSGKPGDFRKQRGYIVPAYGSVLIDGFRTSLESVAAFRFTSPGDSYSARMGTPENVGVIGAAFFAENPPPPPVYRPQIPRRTYPYESREEKRKSEGGLGSSGPSPTSDAPAAASAPSRSRGASKSADGYYAESERRGRDDTSNIGTQYGEETYSQVSEVTFVRASAKSPERVITLRYDDYEGLVARGILPRHAPRYARGPSAFPQNRFAAPPPRYGWE